LMIAKRQNIGLFLTQQSQPWR